mgnify:FL=1
MTLIKMFPRLREDLYYTAPELVSTKVQQMVGINIDEVDESDDVEQLVMTNIRKCRYGPPSM